MEQNPSQLFLPTTLLFIIFTTMPLSSSSSAAPVDQWAAFSTSKIDGEALLLFKKSIKEDPNGVLSNWQLNTSPCTWYGVTCTADGRVARLDLSRCGLVGDVSFRALASIDTLSDLNLSNNFFTVNSTDSLLRLPVGLKNLDLSFSGLVGSVPDNFPSRYPNIVYINLSHNNLTGYLPDNVLSSLDKLQILDLSFNNLSGLVSALRVENTCKSLLHFDLSGNYFTDSIPSSLSNCTGLRSLNLSYNAFTGEIPKSFGELRSLQMMDLSHNHLSGPIPVELGNACGSLVQIKISYNNVSGSIPSSFSSCSVLQELDLSNNNISGPIPDTILGSLGSLERLLLSNNFISGNFPASISLCKSLKIVDLSSNKLDGVIPSDICPVGSVLEELRVPGNLISGEIPPQLANCTQLKTIDLSINYLTGSIPPEIGKLGNLERLMLWFNGFHGGIPSEIGQCSKLKNLILNNNFLSGEIPTQLFNCADLEWVSLTSNGISGPIPPEFGKLKRLAILQLANNSLSGNIPSELVNCSSLVWLDLNSNKLSGEIPPRLGRQLGDKAVSGILSGNTLAFVRNVGNACKGVGGLLEFAGIRPERLLQVPTLKTCDFTRLYSGAALSDWTHYPTLAYLDLSYNDLRGKIPDEFGDMLVLQVLDLAHNKISGEIPASLGQLRNLGVFDAAHNRLQGQIPDSFSNLSFLVEIDLSNNELTGPIPARGQLSTLPATQYANNPGLCGVPLPPCNQSSPTTPTTPSSPEKLKRSAPASWANSIVLGILVSVAFVCILIAWAIAMRARRREAAGARMLSSLQAGNATTWKISKEKEPLSINVATFQRQLRKLTFSQLIEATNGFSADSLIGSGGFGEVFRATLKDGSSVAIKKLIRLSCQGDREFMAEMETLGKIKHRNLVPLLGYCKVGEERLLVYEFMSHGNLEEMLHGKNKKSGPLKWDQRMKIARGAAKGLCFLHHNCIPHIIHRDMKSSNVLLDEEMEARVSDFGMARLISALDTHLSVSTLAGTPGYVPPEYYQSFRCTAKGDVYSFGVVLLEVLTGRRPTDKEDFGDTNLVGWVKMKVREGKGWDVIDPDLVSEAAAAGGDDEGGGDHGHEKEREMMRYLEITMQCVEDFPSKRPNMLQVVAMLRELMPVANVDGNGSGTAV